MDKGEGRANVKLIRCNRVARRRDGRTAIVSRNDRIENPIGWLKIPSRSDLRVCDVSQKPARSAFPALGRENVITDLINWTYGRRRTKWLALPSPPHPPPPFRVARQPELPRSGHCLAMITMKVYQLWAPALLPAYIRSLSRRFRK